MANQVGALTFDVMTGSPSPAGTVAEALPRAVGEDHNRWRAHGLQARDTQITAVLYVPNVETAIDRRQEVHDQQGTEVDIVDAFGTIAVNCHILVATATFRPVFEGGANKYRLLARYIIRQGQPD